MTEQELIELSHAWDRAMVTNDPDAIGEFMADDWLIIGSDGRETDKPSFLAQVRSGALTHDTMTSEALRVRLYGDTAVVLSRGVSGGRFEGRPFRESERVSSLFVRSSGQWRCVLTHLAPLAPSSS
jgi:ketosteroid isomerase-like protein